jgi:hypothetical protein
MAEYAGTWPARPWRLTAPESYVLYLGKSPPGSEALKLALKELILRRALRVEQLDRSGRLGRKRSVSAFRAGSRSTAISEPPLAAVMELYEQTDESHPGDARTGSPSARGYDGVLVDAFARAARRSFGRSLAGYVNDHVFPAMEQRGLLRSKPRKSLGYRSRRRWALTVAGQDAADQLEKWVGVGHRQMAGWVRDDPARGRAYAQAAGAAVLLMSSLYPQLDRLARGARGPEALRDAGVIPATASVASPETASGDAGGEAADPASEMGGFDFGGLESGFGSLDGLDGAFGAIDIGIGGGIGDGGGGGGGGDGGG